MRQYLYFAVFPEPKDIYTRTSYPHAAVPRYGVEALMAIVTNRQVIVAITLYVVFQTILQMMMFVELLMYLYRVS